MVRKANREHYYSDSLSKTNDDNNDNRTFR